MLAAMGRRDARPPDLEKAHVRPPGDERFDVEFAGAVEAEIPLGHVLPQQAVDPDDAGRAVAISRGLVDHDQMVGHPIEAADVAANQPRGRIGRGAALLEEHAIAQLLRPSELLPGRREARLERAGAGERRSQAGKVAEAGEALQERAGRGAAFWPGWERQRHSGFSGIQL